MSAARRCLSAIAVIAVVVCAGLARVDAAGDPAPNVELRGPKGQRQRLADFRGKIVLLKIWASWCPDCKVLFPELDRLSREFKSRGVEVIAVNVDEHRKDADAFLKTQITPLRVMFDPRACCRCFRCAWGAGVVSHRYTRHDPLCPRRLGRDGGRDLPP